MENEDLDLKLYIVSIIGKSGEHLQKDVEYLEKEFLNKKETSVLDYVLYGNIAFFISLEDVDVLSKDLMKPGLAYIFIDITENINVFDFSAFITEEHKESFKLTKMIQNFSYAVESELDLEMELTKSKEEMLIEAIEKEEFELAAKIRDEINQEKNKQEKKIN
jgi:hypothetical protein